MKNLFDNLVSKDNKSTSMIQNQIDTSRHNDKMKVEYGQLKIEQDLLNAINELKAEQQETSKKQAKIERVRFWTGIIVSSIAALAAIIVPIVLHFI